MYLKNNILFFCVTFYFFQCQAARPSSYQFALIKSRVPQLLGQDEITFDKVRTVFSELARELDITFEPSTFDELEKIEYSKEDVITNILACIASSDHITVDMVNELVESRLGQVDVIDIRHIRNVFLELEVQADDTLGPYPRTISGYVLNELKKTAFNRSFTINEIKSYALAFLASGYAFIMDTVNTVITANGDHDSMDYEKYKSVIEGVNERIRFHIPVPSYDLFKADILSRKFTVNGIENMIIEKLFPL